MSNKVIRLTTDERETLSASAAELDGLALDLRMSCSLDGHGIKWDGETGEEYEKLKALSAKLYALAERAA